MNGYKRILLDVLSCDVQSWVSLVFCVIHIRMSIPYIIMLLYPPPIAEWLWFGAVLPLIVWVVYMLVWFVLKNALEQVKEVGLRRVKKKIKPLI